MDLWNNEIPSHSLSAKRGDRMTYISVPEEMEAYIKFFNEERPAYALGYLTPRQYRETYAAVQ